MQSILIKTFFGLGALFFFFLLGFFWAAFFGIGDILGEGAFEGRYGEVLMGAFIGLGVGAAYVIGTFKYRKEKKAEFFQNQALIFWGLCVLSMAAAIIALKTIGMN